jgi:hypothetical protein
MSSESLILTIKIIDFTGLNRGYRYHGWHGGQTTGLGVTQDSEDQRCHIDRHSTAFWEPYQLAGLAQALGLAVEQLELGPPVRGSNSDLWAGPSELGQVLQAAKPFATPSRPAQQRGPFSAPMP